MNNNEFIEKAMILVMDYSKENSPKWKPSDSVYIVWLTKVLQNNKALLSTTIEDGRYYEITYNGDKKEFYFDSYVKEKNICIFNDSFNKIELSSEYGVMNNEK